MSNEKHLIVEKMQCRINATPCRPTQIIKSKDNNELSVSNNYVDLYISCLIFHDMQKSFETSEFKWFLQ